MRTLLLLALAPLAACTSGKDESPPPDDTGDTSHTGDTGGDSIPPGCGDGVTDEGEQCDDANDIDGDGCNRDCVESGSVRWEVTIDGQGSMDCANGVDINADGVIAFGGESSPDGDTYDVFAGVLEADGTTRWTSLVDSVAKGESGGGYTDRGYDVGIEEDGEILVAGHLLETQEHVWLGKFAADGGSAWTREGGETADGRGYGLALGADGEVFMVGTHGATSFASKYNTNGVGYWTEEFSGTDGCNGCDFLFKAAALADGSVVAVGAVDNTSRDALLVRLAADGSTLWSETLDDGGDEYGFAVTAFGDGFLAGVIYSDGRVEWRAYDGAGELLWTLADAGVPDGGWATGVEAAPDGGFFTQAVGWIDSGATSILRTSRFDADGAEKWHHDIQRTSTDGWGRFNALATAGGDLVLGGCQSDDYGVPEDVWIVRMAP